MRVDRFKIGHEGYWEFTVRRKWKRPPKSFDGDPVEIGHRLHAKITDMDDNNLWLVDNDGQPYCVAKRRVKVFERGGRESEKVK